MFFKERFEKINDKFEEIHNQLREVLYDVGRQDTKIAQLECSHENVVLKLIEHYSGCCFYRGKKVCSDCKKTITVYYNETDYLAAKIELITADMKKEQRRLDLLEQG